MKLIDVLMTLNIEGRYVFGIILFIMVSCISNEKEYSKKEVLKFKLEEFSIDYHFIDYKNYIANEVLLMPEVAIVTFSISNLSDSDTVLYFQTRRKDKDTKLKILLERNNILLNSVKDQYKVNRKETTVATFEIPYQNYNDFM